MRQIVTLGDWKMFRQCCGGGTCHLRTAAGYRPRGAACDGVCAHYGVSLRRKPRNVIQTCWLSVTMFARALRSPGGRGGKLTLHWCAALRSRGAPNLKTCDESLRGRFASGALFCGGFSGTGRIFGMNSTEELPG